MKVRRCAAVYFEPREEVRLDLGQLLAGMDGMVKTIVWYALAPHLDTAVVVNGSQMQLLGELLPSDWREVTPAISEAIAGLIELGLVIEGKGEGSHASAADAEFRAGHWWSLAAVLHRHTRWSGVDSVRAMEAAGMVTLEGLQQRLGMPPSSGVASATKLLALPEVASGAFESLLERRVTCRNFDTERALDLPLLSQMLKRVFGVFGVLETESGARFLKKGTPSAGGLHSTEAYLLIRHVDGIEPGLYHYQADAHALVALPDADDVLAAVAHRWVSGQHWFAEAPVLVAMAPRFARTQWKYRNHSKAYRAVVLDVGHLSQTLYLAATDLGLGAFVTAAINECDVEQSLGLSPLGDGPLAVAGFGWRSRVMSTAEFDPSGVIWDKGN
jgi:putative peptide maturation dehydrogenase